MKPLHIGILACLMAGFLWAGEGPRPGEKGEQPAAKPDDSPVMLFPILKGGKWGYMDRAGQVVIEPQYQLAWDFYEGLACVGKDALRGFIDPAGQVVVPLKFGWAGRFSEGLAVVNLHTNKFGEHVEWYRATTGWGLCDRAGKVAARLSYSQHPANVADGIAWTNNGYIDKEGKPVPFEGEEGSSFSEGLAAARKGAAWGYIDRTMKLAIQPQFAAAAGFHDGLAAVATWDSAPPEDPKRLADWEKNRRFRWGFIDKTGKQVIDCRFQEAGRFAEGLAPVAPGPDAAGVGGADQRARTPGAVKTWGYVNKHGTMAIKPQFDYAWEFSEGLGRVLVGEKHGYVNKEGKLVIEPKFDVAWEFAKGLARVGVGEKEGYIDHDGKYVWEPTE